ncbi:MAG: molybdopterin-binding protein [Rickettsiales bacterium]
MQNITQQNKNPKLALIVIGNEILSGRTLDKNTQYIAQMVGKFGIDLVEVRFIPDYEGEIITAVNNLRERYDYVFTTGGIGPTHDDITTECIAKAFGVEVELNQMAYSLLVEYYGGEGNLNPGRIKMAMLPQGAELVLNPVSAAPGFRVGNVFVMAGVPKIMQAMLDNVVPMLRHGTQVESKTVQVVAAESKVAALLTELQNTYPDVQIGSYPYMQSDGYDHVGTNVVFRSINKNRVEEAVRVLVKKLKDETNFEFKL